MELSPSIVMLLWIGAFAAVCFGTGIYVVSGRWAAARPKRDAATITRWDKARQDGFVRFILRRQLSAFPSALVALILLFQSRNSWNWEAVLETAVRLTPAALGLGLVSASSDWFSIRRRAEEAHDRAARLQDERTA